MKELTRFWLAAILAPLSVPALFVLLSLFEGRIFQNMFIAYLATIAAVSYAGFFVLGLPFAIILKSKNKLTYWALFLGGIIAGPLFHILMQVFSGEPVTFQRPYDQILISYTILSVAIAMVFGLIAKARIA